MHATREAKHFPLNIFVHIFIFSKDEQIRQVQKFKYLGYTLTSDGKCRTEIKKRIAITKASFQKMSTILKNRNISFSTKLRVLKTYVWSIFLYGCKTWTITAESKKNLEAAEMWFYRRMLRISWKEKRTNESILEETNQEISLRNTIRKKQLKFLEHISGTEIFRTHIWDWNFYLLQAR